MPSHAHDHDQPHTTGHSNAHLKDRHAPNLSDPASQMVQAVQTLEQSTANLRVSMDKLLSVLQRSTGGGGHGGMGLAHNFLFFSHFSRHGRQASENFFRDFFITGRRISRDFWIADGHMRGTGAGVAHAFADRLTNGARVTTAASLGLAEKGLRAASPEAFATLQKSFELFLARAEGGLIKPSTKLAFALQDGAKWMEKHPATTEWIGKLTAVGVVAGGATLALGTMSRAVVSCAQAATLAAGMFRRFATGPAAAQATASAAGSTAGSTAAGGAAGAAGAATKATRFSRLAGAAGKYGGPLAAVTAGLEYQAAYEPVDLLDSFGPTQGAGMLAEIFGKPKPSDLARKYLGLGGGGETFSDIKRFTSPFGFLDETLKKHTGYSINPMDLFKDTSADPRRKGAGDHMIEPPTGPPAAFLPLDDLWKSYAISMISTTPLDAEIKQARMENFQKMVELQQEANGHLAKIADRPPGLAARP